MVTSPPVPLSFDKERGKILERGAGAPLRHPRVINRGGEIKHPPVINPEPG